MHLMNILNQLNAKDYEKELVKTEFENKVVSFNGVRDYLQNLRNLH